jgi:hypothetical protein
MTLKAVALDMTPERKERMQRACMKIVDMLADENLGKAETMAVLSMVLSAFENRYKIKLAGVVGLGPHDGPTDT